MLNKVITFNHTHNTVNYGMVCNDTEEYYATRKECINRYNELKADNTIAYTFAGYWWKTSNYRVAYAYKAQAT